jgi:hypothetical protein
LDTAPLTVYIIGPVTTFTRRIKHETGLTGHDGIFRVTGAMKV